MPRAESLKKLTQIIVTTCYFFFYPVGVFSQPTQSLKTAWEPWFPYQYLKINSLQSSLTGLDTELVKLFAADASYRLQFQQLAWSDTLKALKNGEMDLAMGATYSAERAQYVYYSKPYRFEENSLFVARSKNKNYAFNNSDEFINYLQQSHFRLGVKKDAIIADAKLNDFVNDPKNSQHVVGADNEGEELKMLLNGEIDGFIADRIVASTLIWQARAHHQVVEHYLKMKTPIHLIFSKKTVPITTVQNFDKAIDAVHDETVYRNTFSWYLYPVIMMQATSEEWFKTLDMLGIIFYAISGVLIAYELNKSFLAALVYAILPSLTGGILRDVIFSNRPVEALVTPEYLITILSVVTVGYGFTKVFDKVMQYEALKKRSRVITHITTLVQKYLKQLLVICDALGLATLSGAGVMISLMARAEPLWLWGPFFAFLTASFGTIIRDIISKKEHLEDVVGEINSEVGIIWGFILSVALILNANNIQPDLVWHLVLLTVAGAFITRLLIHYFKVPNVYFR
ncbi:MAG: TRIC cation channel family protein [Gammaproteobacteria bacterium]